MAWVEKDHNDHPVSTPLLCAGSPTTRPGCPEPHPAWPWMPPGMGHLQPPWATCSSVSPPSVWKNFLLIFSYIMYKLNQQLNRNIPGMMAQVSVELPEAEIMLTALRFPRRLNRSGWILFFSWFAFHSVSLFHKKIARDPKVMWIQQSNPQLKKTCFIKYLHLSDKIACCGFSRFSTKRRSITLHNI